MEHIARVKEANPHDETIPFKRHGRITGKQTLHYSGGYVATCSCGWSSSVTSRSCEAHADKEAHIDDMWSKEHRFDKNTLQWVER